MKLKPLFLLLGLYFLFSTEIVKASSTSNGARITLFGSSHSEEPIYPSKGHRSISMPIPVSAFLNDTHIVELDFNEPIGEVKILISQDGDMVYSSSENIVSTISKNILLPQQLSGSLLLEIKGDSGIYIYGWITIN